MFWGRDWPKYWATSSGFTSLLQPGEHFSLSDDWQWWTASAIRLPRGRYVLSPQLCPLQIMSLPFGASLTDIPALVTSQFPMVPDCKVAWQPLGDRRVLVMVIPRMIWSRLPSWPQPQCWLVGRFNQTRRYFGTSAWSWLCVYPEGASLFAGKGEQLLTIQTVANWQEVSSLLHELSGLKLLDDAFDLVDVLPGWERP